jgi:hypothetical protein
MTPQPTWPRLQVFGFALNDAYRGVTSSELARRGGPQGQVDADVFGIDNRHRPGGLFFNSYAKDFLYEKGIEQCDSFKYLAP